VNRFTLALMMALAALTAACGPVPHPFWHHEDNELVDDRRVTASVRILPVPKFPGLAEAVVKELAKQDVLATTGDAGRRTLYLRGGIEGANLVWRLATPEGKELGALAQAVPPGVSVAALAQEAAPVVVQLLTAEGGRSQPGLRARVALSPMQGPPGIDTRALSQAMADALAARGVAAGGDSPLAIVAGEVRILPGTGPNDVVQVDWTVRDPGGRTLGTVSQGSPVARTSLAGPLDQLARDIAGAAAPGVIQVIRQRAPAALNGG